MLSGIPVTRKPHVLIVLDGFGHSETSDSNAILAADMPNWRQLLKTCPNGLISGSGEDVGLPDGQMGNSEVGHMNLGAGRVVYQDFTRITKDIRDGGFFANPVICAAVDKAVAAGKAVHVLGLLSQGGVHSHEDHLHAMVDLAAQRGAERIYVHAFLDGRDTPPKSAAPSLTAMEAHFARLGKGRVASVIGRYFAMDRDAGIVSRQPTACSPKAWARAPVPPLSRPWKPPTPKMSATSSSRPRSSPRPAPPPR